MLEEPGVKLSNRHTNNVHIRAQSLAAILTAYCRLRWSSHVGRIEQGRLPQIALYSSLHHVFKLAKRGRPLGGRTVCFARKQLGSSAKEWEDACQLRSAWRGRLRQLP